MHYGDANYIYKDHKIKRGTENDIRAEFKKWKASQAKLNSDIEDPYNIYLLKPLKSQSSQRKLTTKEKLDLQRMTSNLSRIMKLGKKLGHLKIALQKNIRILERIKEQEDLKEPEMSEAEKRWSIVLDSFSPGSYKPLDSLGAESHFI